MNYSLILVMLTLMKNIEKLVREYDENFQYETSTVGWFLVTNVISGAKERIEMREANK